MLRKLYMVYGDFSLYFTDDCFFFLERIYLTFENKCVVPLNFMLCHEVASLFQMWLVSDCQEKLLDCTLAKPAESGQRCGLYVTTYHVVLKVLMKANFKEFCEEM